MAIKKRNKALKFTFLYIGIVLLNIFSLSSCSNQTILYVQTANKNYYTILVYTPTDSNVYYKKDDIETKVESIEILPFETVKQAGDSIQKAIQLQSADPYPIISESSILEFDIVHKNELDDLKNAIDENEKDAGWWEAPGKLWLEIEKGWVINNCSTSSSAPFDYTYSNILQAKLYAKVDYTLTAKKEITLKEKSDTYLLSYYTYSVDENYSFHFEKQTIEINKNQIELIKYA